MTREGYSRYFGLSEELKVRSGDDVVLKCSTSASETSIYTWSKNVSICQHALLLGVKLLFSPYWLSHLSKFLCVFLSSSFPPA